MTEVDTAPAADDEVPAAERPLAHLDVLALPAEKFLLVLSNCDGLFPDEVDLFQKVADQVGAQCLVVLASPLQVGT